MSLSRNHWLRKLVLPIFHRLNPGDITIRHHYTGDPVRLHSFKHKGYWWYGRQREAETMETFRQLLSPGDEVLEVGAHIGYVALWLSHLVGPQGQVHTFEPGDNNLPYVRRNVAGYANITLVEKAVGNQCTTMQLYTESLTGQNNSLLANFEGLALNEQNSVPAHVRPVEVDVVSLDSYSHAMSVRPRLIKIDVEGFECEVLEGAQNLLKTTQPIVMVEVQRRHQDVFELLNDLGYSLVGLDGSTVLKAEDLKLNTFCFPPGAEEDLHRTAQVIRSAAAA